MELLKIYIFILFASCHWSFVESRHGYPHYRHQYRHNSRSRFMARLKALGPDKVEELREGKFSINHILPPGFALIDQQIMDVTYKIIQQSYEMGTAYFAFNDLERGFPLYTRPGDEVGYHFIVFQDPFYWRGSGHLILLRKVLGINVDNAIQVGKDNLLYDAYILSLRATIHPQVDVFNADFYVQLQLKREFIRHFHQRRKEQLDKHRPVRLRDRQGHVGRRKRRSSGTGKIKPKKLHIKMNWKSDGDCVLKPLNVSRLLLETVKRKKLEQEMIQILMSQKNNSIWTSKVQKIDYMNNTIMP